MSATTTGSKKLSLGQFIWLGFNYAVGIGFLGNLAVITNFFKWEKGEDGVSGHFVANENSIGVHVIWLFVLLGILASVAALAFAKLAKIHKSDNNGGAYVFARTNFGKFTGFMVAFIQYVILPFLITVQIFNLMKAFFSGEYAGDTGMNLEEAMGSYSQWAPLVLDLLGIIVYFLFAFVIFGGMKLFKKMSNLSGWIKWITSGIMILVGLYLAVENGGDNYHDWFNNSATAVHDGNQTVSVAGDPLKTNGFSAFVKAFNSCFFFFAGFETFATAGKNIENPDKNMGKGILIVMFMATVFYIVLILLFLGAVNPNGSTTVDGAGNTVGHSGFEQNENMGIWTSREIKNIKWLSILGMVAMIISQFALKANVSMQNALYGGTMLQPMSQEGYIPEKYNELNKDGLPVKASNLNFIVTAFVLVLFLVIPDLYQGITKESAIFSVSDLTEASSAITLFIYVICLAAMLKLGIKKVIKLRIAEWVAYSVVSVIFVVMFGYHYYNLFANLATGDMQTVVGSAIELAFIIISVTFGVIWYFSYYKPKLKQRLSTVEGRKYQEELDSEFVLVSTDTHVFSGGSALLHAHHVGATDKSGKKIDDKKTVKKTVKGEAKGSNQKPKVKTPKEKVEVKKAGQKLEDDNERYMK